METYYHLLIILFFNNVFLYISAQLENDEIKDNVQNLTLEDVYHSLILNDGFPVYFKCKFNIFNRSFSILFRKTNHFNPYFDHKEHKLLYQNYESIFEESSPTFVANCALFLNLKSFGIFKNDFSSNFNLFSNEWLKHQSGNNLLQTFDILLKIVEIGLKISNSPHVDLHISIDFSNYEEFEEIANPRVYKAYLKRITLNSPKTYHKKRQVNRNTKNRLTVESCVHLNHEVYDRIKRYLQTSDKDYIKMYISLKYSIVIYNVNKIYETINDNDISISVELVEIITHENNIKNSLNDTNSSYAHFFSANKFVNDFYSNQSNKCDHVFYVHSFINSYILGQAMVGNICKFQDHKYTSTHLYLPYNYITFAHELGHNIGAHHDSQLNFTCKYKDDQLMAPVISFKSSVLSISECTINQFKSTLLYSDGHLKDQYDCLSKKNNSITKFDTNLLEKQPGYYYSLSGKTKF
jgi:hypothetical protein